MAFLVGAAVALLAAGCGGGSSTYSLGKTRACLQARGATIAHPSASDLVATTALGGSLKAELGDNFVTLAFGTTVANAEQLVSAYEHFAFPNVQSGLPDVLRRVGNVVMLWHEHPQDADLALVTGCLK